MKPQTLAFNVPVEPSKCMGFVMPWSRPLLQLFVYLRSAYEDGMVEIKLVASKICVSTLMKQNIPHD